MIKSCLFKRKVLYSIGVNGKKVLDFKNSVAVDNWDNKQYIELQCDKCIYCMTKYSNNWAVRCVLEASQYKENCFLTLTYNNENLPAGEELVKRDLQLFLKRLRKKISPIKIRFFAAGEYGSKGKRPHYHMIVFGWKPKDLVKWKVDKDKTQLYLSDMVAKVWGKGFISVGVDLTEHTAKYVSKYLTKLQDTNDKEQQPYVVMSNRPGIGAGKFSLDMYKTDKIYVAGKAYSMPRYFDKLAERELEIGKLHSSYVDMETIKWNRYVKGVQTSLNDEQLKQQRLEYFNLAVDMKVGYQHLFQVSPKEFKAMKDYWFETYEEKNKNIKETIEKQKK